MIELLKIHALVRTARVLVFVGAAAEELSVACRRSAGRILDEAAASSARPTVLRYQSLRFESA